MACNMQAMLKKASALSGYLPFSLSPLLKRCGAMRFRIRLAETVD